MTNMDDAEFRVTVLTKLAVIEQQLKNIVERCVVETRELCNLEVRVRAAENEITLHGGKIKMQASVVALIISAFFSGVQQLISYLAGRHP